MDELTPAYFQMLEQLLPRGPAWSEDDRLLNGLAPSLASVHERADDLVRETDPRQTTELIDRWERICGLPDTCAPPGMQTLVQRQQRLDAKVNLSGGITENFYLATLAALGYPDATISNYYDSIFLCTSDCTASVYDETWRYVWVVNFKQPTQVNEMVCVGECIDPLRYWGDTVAECVINKLCASHTIVLFTYPDDDEINKQTFGLGDLRGNFFNANFYQ